MYRTSAGISGQYAGPGNDYNQPENCTASSKPGRYRHANVKQWHNSPALPPGVMNVIILLAHVLLIIYCAAL
ncbi:hypothetical protein [Endozoicomonas sp. GU-1]|uniref:hypothetical protein n=1 Tax=Endozoicomonas sp. GU-1 TaxID=3009078 RepID=UPI0022B35D5C|nr:hypothetical protein [Endozoicomonas sp. GU-1]WBA79391.1 hypothetical protein O2T12_13445 [Endozoicomonas sp. GU-1]